MSRLAFRQQSITFRAQQLISKVNYFFANVPEVRTNYNFVIIMHGSLVTAARIDDGDEAVVFTSPCLCS